MASIEIHITTDSGTELVVRRPYDSTPGDFDAVFKQAVTDVYLVMKQ